MVKNKKERQKNTELLHFKIAEMLKQNYPFPGKVISSSVQVNASLLHFLTESPPCKKENYDLT